MKARRFLMLWNAVLSVGCLCLTGQARASDAPQLSAAELYVLEQATNGSVADLAANFSSKSNQVIGVAFLIDLLTGGKKGVHPNGVRIKNAIIEETLNLRNLEVIPQLQLECCWFKKDVDLAATHFHRGVSFGGSVFSGWVDATEIKADSSLTLNACLISREPPFDLRTTNITLAQLQSLSGNQNPVLVVKSHEATYEIWRNEEGDKSFSLYRPTQFDAEFKSRNGTIQGNLEGWAARFRGPLKGDGLKVDGTIYLDSASFAEQVSFGYATVGKDFSLEAARFSAANSKLNCFGVRVGGSLRLLWANFADAVDFENTQVANNLNAHNARFAGATSPVSFRGMAVGHSAYFNDATFAGPVNFILGHVKGNFEARRARFLNTNDFKELRKFTLDKFTFNADFGSMKAGGFAIFEKASFARAISFRNASLADLYFDSVDWPDINFASDPGLTNLLRIEGMTYQRIRSISEEHYVHSKAQLRESCSNLTGVIARYSPYNFDTYDNLEKYFRREGEPKLANQIFLEHKHREMALSSSQWDRVWYWILRLTIGHGREPWKAVVVSAGLVLIGFLCALQWMQEKGGKPNPRWPVHLANCFFYSVDCFVPLLRWKVEDRLEPKPNCEAAAIYFYVHKTLGLIFVPIWTAALTGLIR